MLFHLFCEFADGSAKYLHLNSSNQKEAYREAIQVHSASVVLFIINSLDPACRLLELDCHYRSARIYCQRKAAEDCRSVIVD